MIPIKEVSSISVFDAGIMAAYVLPIKDRFSMNFGVTAGFYKAVQRNSLTGFDAGIKLSFMYKARPSVSIGAGTSFAHFAAGNTALINGLTVSPEIAFNLTEAFTSRTKIKMETQEILPVFPVLYSWYEDNRFATVKITNEENSPIENIKVSFFQPQYMGHPNICFNSSEIKLDAGKSINVDLTAFFNERMLEMTEKSDTQAMVTVEYTYLGQKKSQDFPMIIPVYGRNSMSWADDRRAAVFVSSKDPAAMLYSKYVSSVVRENMRIGVPKNIQYAMGIFDLLAEFGVNYVIDPSSAYTDNVGTETPDFLQFPYQTLSYRGGDCDDLSILVCSLLEAVGIDTAFITIPGHIYIAFNSGITKRLAQEQFGSLDSFIVLDDEVWVPLEITLTDEGFNKAWRVGAREWHVAQKNGDAAIYKMKDSWKTYKPVSVPGATVTFSMPEKETIAAAFENCIDTWILREIGPKIDAYKAKIAQGGDISAQNDLGVLYGRYGLFDLANEQLAAPSKQGFIPAMINSANVLYSKKKFAEAKNLYKKVLEREPSNVLANLGVARCSYELEDYAECDRSYLKVCELDNELAQSYSYLGAFENTTGRAFNLADRLAYTVWQSDGKTVQETEIADAEEKNVSYVGLPKQITIPTPYELFGIEPPAQAFALNEEEPEKVEQNEKPKAVVASANVPAPEIPASDLPEEIKKSAHVAKRRVAPAIVETERDYEFVPETIAVAVPAPLVAPEKKTAVLVEQEPVRKPAPIVEQKPAPIVEQKPAPIVEQKPAPKPAPVQKPAAPVEKKPAPVAETKPAPKPAPAAKKPAPERVVEDPLPKREAEKKPVYERVVEEPLPEKAEKKPVYERVVEEPLPEKIEKKPVYERVVEEPLPKRETEKKPVYERVVEDPLPKREAEKKPAPVTEAKPAQSAKKAPAPKPAPVAETKPAPKPAPVTEAKPAPVAEKAPAPVAETKPAPKPAPAAKKPAPVRVVEDPLPKREVEKKPAPKPAPVVEQKALEKEWYICVASFEFLKNAQEMYSQMNKAGTKTFVEPAFTKDKKRIYRVMLNKPFAEKIQAERFAADKNLKDTWVCQAPIHSSAIHEKKDTRSRAGSFSFRRYAQVLQQDLKNEGIESSIVPVFLENGMKVYRVMVDENSESLWKLYLKKKQ